VGQRVDGEFDERAGGEHLEHPEMEGQRADPDLRQEVVAERGEVAGAEEVENRAAAGRRLAPARDRDDTSASTIASR